MQSYGVLKHDFVTKPSFTIVLNILKHFIRYGSSREIKGILIKLIFLIFHFV